MSMTGNIGATSTPPAWTISQRMQIRQTLISSWHNSDVTMAGSRSSPQQKHSTGRSYDGQRLCVSRRAGTVQAFDDCGPPEGPPTPHAVARQCRCRLGTLYGATVDKHCSWCALSDGDGRAAEGAVDQFEEVVAF